MYLYIKALHIIFLVTWFAGLFYIGRLFIYYAEAGGRPGSDKKLLQDQLTLMASRLWAIITWPGMLLTLATGIGLMAVLWPDIMKEGWFHIKLTALIGLFVYHMACGRLVKKMKNGEELANPERLRMYNEIPTMFLFAIVFLAVLKSTLSLLYALVGLVTLGILLMIGIKVYRGLRRDPNF